MYCILCIGLHTHGLREREASPPPTQAIDALLDLGPSAQLHEAFVTAAGANQMKVDWGKGEGRSGGSLWPRARMADREALQSPIEGTTAGHEDRSEVRHSPSPAVPTLTHIPSHFGLFSNLYLLDTPLEWDLRVPPPIFSLPPSFPTSLVVGLRQVVERLLKAGANPNKPREEDEVSALMLASQMGDLAMVEVPPTPRPPAPSRWMVKNPCPESWPLQQTYTLEII